MVKLIQRNDTMKLKDIIIDSERLFIKDQIPHEYLSDDYLGKGNPAHALIFVNT